MDARTDKNQNEFRKEFENIFRSLIREKSERKVWEDLITYSACKISLSMGQDRRQKMDASIREYSGNELDLFDDMFLNVAAALNENPKQDYLGDMYMQMGLGSKIKNQYFTPYSVAEAMVKVSTINEAKDIKEQIRRKYWAKIHECACGGGVFAIAVANELRAAGINYQKDVLFVCQDLDETSAMMCYVQMSFLGCPGYVKVGDTLTDPIRFRDEKGLLPIGDVWVTPMMGRDIWDARVSIAGVSWKLQNNVKVTADEWAALMRQIFK